MCLNTTPLSMAAKVFKCGVNAFTSQSLCCNLAFNGTELNIKIEYALIQNLSQKNVDVGQKF